eukprot:TRINITY_DN87398_c0_g1_i1.p2 TRINITY_DN87398_c0_g1~~TRINITY_DN87398_c0_g1_i1.p2  ORF type:complete len:184 (-),score=0.16 TRINITY_DN87398_c0_g1_i1:734-1285(-)
MPCVPLRSATHVGLKFRREPLLHGVMRAVNVALWELIGAVLTVLIFAALLLFTYLGCVGERTYSGPYREVVDKLADIGELTRIILLTVTNSVAVLWPFHLTRCWTKSPIACCIYVLLMCFSLGLSKTAVLYLPAPLWLGSFSRALHFTFLLVLRPIIVGYIASRTVKRQHVFNVFFCTAITMV